MSRLGKISFAVAALCAVIAGTIWIILGVWIPLLYLLIAAAGIALLTSLIFDRKVYFEFFTLRTTKHGMNMGALILIAFALAICVNYVSVRHNKTWDVTTEKLNSLSDQSLGILKGLDSDVEFKIFYKGAAALDDRQNIRQSISIFQENSPKVKIRFIDSYVENNLAQEYLSTLPDKDQQAAFLFVDYKGKKIRIDAPYGEEQITSALVKATRREQKKIYFLSGHSERELTSEGQQGLKAFSDDLTTSSYVFEELNLTEKSAVPADAAMVAVIGPKAPLLDSEIAVLKKYIEGGGHVLLAVDPGERHNLSQLTRWMGVDFKNNFVIYLDPATAQATGTALGVVFDPNNPITSAFPVGKTLTVFDLASELSVDVSKPESIEISELIQSSPSSFALKELKGEVRTPKETKSFPLMMDVKGKIGDSKSDFHAVVVGDSDFMTNRLFAAGSNRDLALNAFASLTDQSDLISVRPRQAAASKIFLTSSARVGMILAGISLPIFLLLLSAFFWVKRRGA